jgi:hypothetical protein
MKEQLIDYWLGQLNGHEKARVEARLTSDVQARRQLKLLREGFAPLSAERAESAPPQGLGVRTLAHIAEHLCQQLPQAPATPAPVLAPSRSWWRRADLLVAASLLIGALSLLSWSIYQLRGSGSAATRVACQQNLQEFYLALKAYHDQHGRFPDVSTQPAPHNVAGMVVPILIEAGVLSDKGFTLGCPGDDQALRPGRLLVVEVRKMTREEFLAKANHRFSYAYGLGFRDEQGVYHPPGSRTDQLAAQVPLMADFPGGNPFFGNSPNHASVGQNVLFTDGSIRFVTLRTLGGDDFFLNRNREVHAGLGAYDFCLGGSDACP